MTEKEKKAIEGIKPWLEFEKSCECNKGILLLEYIDTVIQSLEQKDKEIKKLNEKIFLEYFDMQVVYTDYSEKLNEYKKEIQELKEKWNKDTHTLQNQLDVANADLYECNNIISDYIDIVESKDKIIDLMATTLQDYSDYFRRMRKEEIKQYFDFERRVRKENERN